MYQIACNHALDVRILVPACLPSLLTSLVMRCMTTSCNLELFAAQAGVPARASEIFDWLRGLPGAHPLSALCDVYTYTTIIAQVGRQVSWQSVPTSRGILWPTG